jgi:hypothetical protein
MSSKTKNTLRLISVVLVLLLVFMKIGMFPIADIYEKFWAMVLAYALMLITLK